MDGGIVTDPTEPDPEALTTAAAWLHDSYTCPREPTCTDCLAFVQSIHAYADLREVVLRTKLSEAEARIKDLGFLLPKLQARVDEAEAKLAQAEKDRDEARADAQNDYKALWEADRTLVTSLVEALQAALEACDDPYGMPDIEWAELEARLRAALSQAREKGAL